MMLKYLDKLQENIEDKLLPKPDGKFSGQEKTLFDNFIFSILKKDIDFIVYKISLFFKSS